MADRCSAREIATELGRSIDAVYTRAHILNVYLEKSDWSLDRLSTLFAVDERTIKKAWINTGILPFRRVDGGARFPEWRFREEEIERFIHERPWAYDAGIMIPRTHRLVQMAQRIHRRDPWIPFEDAAQRMEMSRSALWRYCRAGLVPFQRRAGGQGGVGGKIVIRESDIPAAMERCRQHYEDYREGKRRQMLVFVAARKAAA